jgi:membrane-associated phospholipid phosphatase
LNTRLANLISVVFHPLLMPTYLFLMLFLFAPAMAGVEAFGLEFRFYLLSFLFLYTFILPGVSVYWFKRLGLVKSIKMEERSDRPLPMFATAAIYITMAYFLFSKNPLLGQIGLNLFIIALVILSIGIISFFWQISAHTAGIGGLVGILMKGVAFQGEELLFYPTLIFFVLAGLIMSARLQLNAHTPQQTLAGFFLGWAIGFGSLLIF